MRGFFLFLFCSVFFCGPLTLFAFPPRSIALNLMTTAFAEESLVNAAVPATDAEEPGPDATDSAASAPTSLTSATSSPRSNPSTPSKPSKSPSSSGSSAPTPNVSSSSADVEPQPIATPNLALTNTVYPEGLISIPETAEITKYVFLVSKKDRRLWVLEREGVGFRPLEEIETDIGKSEGEKTKANDFKTPTGIYFLTRKLTSPEIPFYLYGSLAFTTDYPNIFDRADARSGSGIWLHAVPDSVPLTRGSRGCVVVRNEMIQKLAKYVHVGQTPLVIYNEVKFLAKADYDQLRQKYLDFFEKWRTSWETQDVDAYIRFYDGTFRSDTMDLKHWYEHKKKMKSLYKEIHVSLSTPLIIWNKDQVVLRTFQNYRSDLHEDYGLKTIHARATPDDGLFGFKIIREEWKAARKPQLQAK